MTEKKWYNPRAVITYIANGKLRSAYTLLALYEFISKQYDGIKIDFDSTRDHYGVCISAKLDPSDFKRCQP